MKQYPKGAIKSINELLEHQGEVVWEASKKHSILPLNETYCALKITGRIGSKWLSSFNQEKGRWYYWFQYEYANNDKFKCKKSLLDKNVIENSYNDWFLFPNREDAEAYLKS